MIKPHEKPTQAFLLMFRALGDGSDGVILHSGLRRACRDCGNSQQSRSLLPICLSIQQKKACEATLERHVVLTLLD